MMFFLPFLWIFFQYTLSYYRGSTLYCYLRHMVLCKQSVRYHYRSSRHHTVHILLLLQDYPDGRRFHSCKVRGYLCLPGSSNHGDRPLPEHWWSCLDNTSQHRILPQAQPSPECCNTNPRYKERVPRSLVGNSLVADIRLHWRLAGKTMCMFLLNLKGPISFLTKENRVTFNRSVFLLKREFYLLKFYLKRLGCNLLH